VAICRPKVDPLDARFARMARERDKCLRTLREHLGHHLPPPVVGAVSELAENMLRLGVTPDEDLDETIVQRL
jgi:hypothetical protein